MSQLYLRRENNARRETSSFSESSLKGVSLRRKVNRRQNSQGWFGQWFFAFLFSHFQRTVIFPPYKRLEYSQQSVFHTPLHIPVRVTLALSWALNIMKFSPTEENWKKIYTYSCMATFGAIRRHRNLVQSEPISKVKALSRGALLLFWYMTNKSWNVKA